MSGGVLNEVFTEEPVEVIVYDFDEIKEGTVPVRWVTQESDLESEEECLNEEVKDARNAR